MHSIAKKTRLMTTTHDIPNRRRHGAFVVAALIE